MVKARFPGKPSKHFNRRKVPAVNSEDNEGINAAEDVYRRLAVFYSLFHTEDEDNIFHGFSPHECEKKINDESQSSSVTSISNKKRKVHFSPKKNHSTKAKASTNNVFKDCLDPKPECSTSLLPVEELSKEVHSEPVKILKHEDKDISVPNATLSGKFVLPSRSAHSSRVIKPNKRFLQSDTSSIPCKKSRLSTVSDYSSQQKATINNSENSMGRMTHSYDRHYKKTDADGSSSSPVKFVLRKPRLKIKSQPLSAVGGPFTSPSNSALGSQALQHQNSSVTKVLCGVCGSVKTYKLFRQVRKFGIHSCDPCRKFIHRIIRSERQKLLQPLLCTSGSGNCPIRHNSLIAPCFSTEPLHKNTASEQERCEACWLNLCLRSFHMPQKLTKRLSSFLPLHISQKSILLFNKCHTTDWNDLSSDTQGIPLNPPELRLSKGENCESRIIRRNKGVRENINVRRGSTTSLRLSSHRGRGFEEGKRGRGRQKLPVAGPRVKHVCRSASLVLGQPVATFDPTSSAKDEAEPSIQSKTDESQNSEDVKLMDLAERERSPTNVNEKLQKPNVAADVELFQERHTNIDYPPIARMLQDLGRANCELLDGMENHELERLNAKVSIDFWESYDPEEVSQMGFPLIGFNPLRLKALCFLCGSAGLEKMVHCASCCEPYHTFCVPNLHINSSGGDWWRLDWLCPKCTQCEACLRTGGTQLSCTKCQKSYHSNCISTARANISDHNWVCPSCLFCKSCNDSSVHVFVGNMPLCKACFKLRKKGNFCPLCQCCYDDNDYNTKMMECADCKCWIHAECEGISNEKYQVLSYLPSTVEFICRLCCKNPPAPWSHAVNAELKAGYLNVIKVLSKNKNACAMFKASPKKQRVCVCLDKHRNPIHLPNLLSSSETESFGIESDISPGRDYKSSDFGLLTPKLTKDDEESLKTVKTDFLNLVTDKDGKSMDKKSELICCNKESQLLKIDYDKLANDPRDLTPENKFNEKNTILSKEKPNLDIQDRICTCQITDSVPSNSLSLLSVKHKANSDGYHSVCEFHKDMECIVKEIGNSELIDSYNRCLKQIFPWFDPHESRISETLPTELKTIENKVVESPKPTDKQKVKKEEYSGLKGLLNLDQESYYIGLNVQETRICLFCKSVGEGFPLREGRLLYCGQNEWVHTNCALWSSEVFEEIDGSLQNVLSAVSRARLIRCVQCGKKGASLGCCSKSCPAAYHFACAINAECIFLENKEVYCKLHSNQRGDSEIHKDEDFHIKRSVYVELDHKKKKDVLRSQVRMYIGALEVSEVGEILPELSDDYEVILPCEFKCSRLYWSWKEPWKIVRYSIQTKVTNTSTEYTYENDTNYTVDHSLEFTPPPSPVESVNTNAFLGPGLHEKEVRLLLTQIVDTVCSREEEGNLSDQQSTDLLPPDLKDVIFDELPQDFLERISVHDIFTKMSFDDVLSESRGDKGELNDGNTNIEPFCTKLKASDCSKDRHKKSMYQVVRVVKPKSLDKIKDCEVFMDCEKVNKWKRQSMIQVDGAMDLSESDQSNDSCDVNLSGHETIPGSCESNEDKPVKCTRCHRTYRTGVSYERHLPTCNADFSSCSESDLSEEEKTQGLPEENGVQTEVCITNVEVNAGPLATDSQHHVFNVPIEMKSITTSGHKIQTLVQNSFENSIVCVNNTDFNGIRESTESIVNINYTTLNNEPLHNSSFPSDQALVASVDSVVPDPVMSLPQPTIILQPVPNENVLSTSFMSSSYQEPQQPNIQYITAINTQEKTQFLTANSIGPSTYHIQPQLPQPVVQNVSTVLGTIVQPNGVEQLVVNNTGPSLDVYGHHQNGMFLTSGPMLVGMETHACRVVSNTVTSSSRYISGTTPGMLASSYSATTTQVFQAAKPVIDIPQSYVVVNTNPSLVESNGACMQNIIQNGSVPNPSWNGYKISYHDPLKLNKNITYQTVSQQIVTQKQDVNNLKLVNPNDQTILLASMPPVKLQNSSASHVIMEKYNSPPQAATPTNFNCLNSKPSNSVKIVELPSSSAIHKEKPQQAVAPVVIKKITEPTEVKEVHNQTQPPVVKFDANSKIDNSSQVLLMNPGKNIVPTPQASFQVSNPTNNASDAEDVVCNNKPDDKSDPNIIQTKENSFNKNCISSNSKQKDTYNVETVRANGSENNRKRKIVQEEPRISFEITSDDGFSVSTTSLDEAWNTVFKTVQNSRKARGLPPLSQNPFSSPDMMLKKLMGLGNNSMKYILEQLPGISSCSKYKPVYHKKMPSALEKELSKGRNINPTGCARTEKFKYTHKTYDMFSWLASRHRRPPKLINSDTEGLNGNSRRATSMNLPMAMRFRHLKETSKLAVGVFRSDIHGRGLFCLRDIDSGEMVIEYAGEVIRSALTDKRERYYTEKGIGCYMFRIDDKFVVDATMKGNAARFINHSCEPNCYSRVIDILGKKHILIFALRKILQGEELTYDYKFPLEEDKINCHCLSRKCRKYLN